jgi:hypothetical protein
LESTFLVTITSLPRPRTFGIATCPIWTGASSVTPNLFHNIRYPLLGNGFIQPDAGELLLAVPYSDKRGDCPPRALEFLLDIVPPFFTAVTADGQDLPPLKLAVDLAAVRAENAGKGFKQRESPP